MAPAVSGPRDFCQPRLTKPTAIRCPDRGRLVEYSGEEELCWFKEATFLLDRLPLPGRRSFSWRRGLAALRSACLSIQPSTSSYSQNVAPPILKGLGSRTFRVRMLNKAVHMPDSHTKAICKLFWPQCQRVGVRRSLLIVRAIWLRLFHAEPHMSGDVLKVFFRPVYLGSCGRKLCQNFHQGGHGT